MPDTYLCPVCLRPPPRAVNAAGKPIGRPPLYCAEHAILAHDLERLRAGLAAAGPGLSAKAKRRLRSELMHAVNVAFNGKEER